MATTQQPKDRDPAPVPSKTTVILLIGTLVDTTLRLFIPVIAGLLIGLWIDHQTNTKPALTIVGVLIGVVVAALLIYAQIKAINKEKT
ncbi:MAG TPA: AtpZ/AtpI family protein [Verrucomicrobiae bacterium]|nr:AtpZ/AtpI family protein [Verrucomicrobiae bacterium]